MPVRDTNAETVAWLVQVLEQRRRFPGEPGELWRLRAPPHRFRRLAILADAAPGLLPAGVTVLEVVGLPAVRVRLDVEALGELSLAPETKPKTLREDFLRSAEAALAAGPRTPFGQVAEAMHGRGDS